MTKTINTTPAPRKRACNLGLGHFKDNYAYLINAATYIKKNQ